MPDPRQFICSTTWWDSKLFNALIHPELRLEPPRWLPCAAPTTPCSIHHPNGLYIFNPCHLSGGGGVMMGGVGGGIKFPNVCCSSTGRPLIHGPLFLLALLLVLPISHRRPLLSGTSSHTDSLLFPATRFPGFSLPKSSFLCSRTLGMTARCTSPR